MLSVAVIALALAPPQLRRVTGREASNLCSPVAALCAEAILSATERTEKAILTSALERDLRQRVGGGQSALWVVQDAESNIVGSCAIEVCTLSSKALDAQRLRGTNALDTDLGDRPLLSSLAVSPKFRKRGLAKKLCREAEALAKEWGYDEVLLRVESDNGRARNLYRKLGYRVVDTDKGAERPVAGAGGLKYVPTVQVAMRKSLKFPPIDSVLGAIVLAAGVVLNQQALSDAAALVADGQVAEALALLLQLVTGALPPAVLEQLEPWLP